ncbi:hypothetical protein FR943_13570 [Mycobacterium sp. TNTM28]|uniref:Uncharacterized protein n=1 Tax=[Mycobacterium] fortunisiensis TaxID=2600579 RepID=A0ABS6KMS0_9MYCO|nr:hypothetical protein [[Mycobacterium] fortunisiensis]MBU9764866.1 hypothetical protein [[Mycobacterium] fortunisiensis]
MPKLARRYEAMAGLGPRARLSLEPSAQTNRWRVCRVDPAEVITATDPLPTGVSPTQLVTTIRARQSDRSGNGIRILCAGDHLAIDFSHGLGEAALISTLLDVLLGVVDPCDPDLWRRFRHHRAPLLRAALDTFGADPRRIAGLAGLYRRRPRPAAPPGTRRPSTLTERFVGSPATRSTVIPAEFVNQLRRRRDTSTPGVSMMALCTHALWESFANAGLPVDGSVKIPFDIRRYIRDGSSTLASASAGLDFAIDAQDGPARLQADMDRSARTGRPVANLLISTMKARLGQGDPTEPHPQEPRVQLLHSNVLRAVATQRWPFTDHADAHMLVSSEPVNAEGVTVTSAWTSGNLCLTAEFHRNVFDPDQIGAALNAVGPGMLNLIDIDDTIDRL